MHVINAVFLMLQFVSKVQSPLLITFYCSLSNTVTLDQKWQTISFSSFTVIVESVKCLCNVYLMNKQLVSGSANLGIIEGLSQRLYLHQTITLPHDVLYYDLRLLFLLTACDPGIR